MTPLRRRAAMVATAIVLAGGIYVIARNTHAVGPEDDPPAIPESLRARAAGTPIADGRFVIDAGHSSFTYFISERLSDGSSHVLSESAPAVDGWFDLEGGAYLSAAFSADFATLRSPTHARETIDRAVGGTGLRGVGFHSPDPAALDIDQPSYTGNLRGELVIGEHRYDATWRIEADVSGGVLTFVGTADVRLAPMRAEGFVSRRVTLQVRGVALWAR